MGNVSPSACMEIKDGTHVAKIVLMPGDPLRAKYVAETYLENPVVFNDVRNMLGYTGTFEGVEVSGMGSGMGIPSIGLYAHELFNFFGVEGIIRIGSAGGVADTVNVRDVVVAMSATTNSAYPSRYGLPGTLSPTADWAMLRDAVNIADEIGVRTSVGSVYSSDFFYYPDPAVAEKERAAGLLAVEMEAAGLYTEAMYAHKKALALFTVSDHLFKPEHLTPEEIKTSFNEMMLIALKTAAKATKELEK
ncbi:MAG: purine-nucleoside phosphorylase [Eubacterium sp.]|nr:purine-nucleoside phosphorylase [Eubacterium sp.]